MSNHFGLPANRKKTCIDSGTHSSANHEVWSKIISLDEHKLISDVSSILRIANSSMITAATKIEHCSINCRNIFPTSTSMFIDTAAITAFFCSKCILWQLMHPALFCCFILMKLLITWLTVPTLTLSFCDLSRLLGWFIFWVIDLISFITSAVGLSHDLEN